MTIAECNPDIISLGDHVILKLPSNNSKIVHLKSLTEIIHLGKFGSFKSSELVGNFYEIPLEINSKDNSLKVMESNFLSEFDLISDQNASNQEINDSTESQKLSHRDIEGLKDLSMKGEMSCTALIKSIVENNSEFDKKTEFSKIKYLERKASKFMKMVCPIRPTALALCDFFMKKNPFKIRELRFDTLTQMLCLGNVRADSRFIVVDDVGGLLTASVLERMNGMGSVFILNELDHLQLDIPCYLNGPGITKILQHLSWQELLGTQSPVSPQESQEQPISQEPQDQPGSQEDQETTPEKQEDQVKKHPERLIKKQEKVLKIQQSKDSLLAGGFDGLLIASQYDPLLLVKTLSPYLHGSRPIVVYSQYKEQLHEAYSHTRNSNRFVNSNLTESWYREYQVPSGKGGMHPHMSGSGTGGYLLSAITVIPRDVEPMIQKGKKRKTIEE